MCREKEENENYIIHIYIFRQTIPTKETHQNNNNIEVPTYYYIIIMRVLLYSAELKNCHTLQLGIRNNNIISAVLYLTVTIAK